MIKQPIITPLIIDGVKYYSVRIIRAMRNAGYSWVKIGELHGVSHVAVRYWYNKYGNISSFLLDSEFDYTHRVGKRGRLSKKDDPNTPIIDVKDALPPKQDIDDCLWTLRHNVITPQEKNALSQIISLFAVLYGQSIDFKA